MKNYNTKKRQILMDFLDKNHDFQFTAEEIYEYLKYEDISLSAIYRNLSKLEEEGKVKRLSKVGELNSYYLFTDSKECVNKIHLSCKKCGKTFHLENDTACSFLQSLKNNQDFLIDEKSTVIYGLCKNCQKEKSKEIEKKKNET